MTVHVPSLSSEMVLPLVPVAVHVPLAVNETVKPDVAVAVTTNAGSLTFRSGSALNVIDCEASATVTV